MEQTTEYKIVVTRVQHNVPYTEKEYQITSDKGDGSARQRQYDYVSTEKKKQVETKVYEQTLTTIDLGGLAVFINTKE